MIERFGLVRQQRNWLVGASTLAVTMAAGPASTQQVVVGSPACPIAAGVATCSGNLSGGVTSQQSQGHAPVSVINVTGVIGEIAPPGLFGVGADRSDRDVTINVADGVVIRTLDNLGIVEPAQGIVLLVRGGFDATVDSGATIFADGGAQPNAGIEAVVYSGDSNSSITNRGAVTVTTTSQSGFALAASTNDATGNITIANSGVLRATTGGSGERTGVTAGILAVHAAAGGTTQVTNSGAITVRPAAATSDSDFNGIASGIVVNTLVSGGRSTIVNSGAIDALGQATHGITNFAQGNVAGAGTLARIENTGTIAISGADNNGLFAQGRGEAVDLTVINGAAGAVTMANGTNSNGILVLNQGRTGTLTVDNDAALTSGAGASSRGIAVSSSGAPANGNYVMNVDNSGAIELGTLYAQGITVFATRDDTANVTLVNSGTIRGTASNTINSVGLSVNLDGAGTGDNPGVATIRNSGDITLAQGTAIISYADDVTVENSATLRTTGAASDVVGLVGSGAGSVMRFTTTGDVVATGANSNAIVVVGTASTAAVTIDAADVTVASGSAALLVDGDVATTFRARNASVVTGNLRFGAGNDVLAFEAGSRLVGNVDFGAGNDSVTIVNGTLSGTVALGAGDDVLTFQTPTLADILAIDSVDGGTGNDTINLNLAAGTSIVVPDIAGLAVSNVETIAQYGDATVTIHGAAPLATRYELREGQLNLEATLAAVDVATSAGTLLNLGGSVRNLSIAGDLSPGGAGTIATANVLGTFTTVAGSRYLVDILGNGTSDRIAVNGAATLGGGTVVVRSVTPVAGFAGNTSFTILSATGGVTGTFAGVSEVDLPFLTLALVHNANDVQLTATRAAEPTPTPTPTPVAFASVAQTFNQRQVAGVFDAVESIATGDMRTVINALVFASTNQALTGFDTMSGEVHAAALASGVHQGEILTDAMHNRLRATGGGTGGAAGLRSGAWLSGGLIDGRVRGDGNGARLDGSRRGITGGIDFADAATGTLVGVAGGWSSGDVTSDARRSKAELDSWHLGAYGRFGTGRAGLTLAGSFAWSSGDADVMRQIAVNTISRTARTSYNLKTTTLAGEARYGFAVGGDGRFSIGPIANVAHARASRDAFAEGGAGDLNISGADDSDRVTSWGVGGFANWVSGLGRVDVSVAYDRADGDFTETRLALAGAPGNAYLVRSPGGGDNAVKASVTGDVGLGGGWGIGATYRGRMGGDFTAHSALVTLHWRR